MEVSEKICRKCKVLKSSDQFPAKKKSADGRALWCRSCFKANWEKRYYENHEHYRQSHNTSRSAIREQNAKKVFEYLMQHPCGTCGESDPVVLEFDHRDPGEKLESISNLIRNSTWKRIEREIEKCDVLCANCHRRKSARQFGYKRQIFAKV